MGRDKAVISITVSCEERGDELTKRVERIWSQRYICGRDEKCFKLLFVSWPHVFRRGDDLTKRVVSILS